MNGIRWSKVNTTANPETVIIVCSGPSLQNFNFENLRGKGYIIAVNDAGRFIPSADAWFTLDPWGLTTTQIPKGFNGELFAAVPDDYGMADARNLEHRVTANPNVNYLHRISFHTDPNTESADFLRWGLSMDPSCIHTGNSGYGALNIAYHMRPKRIAFFGLDASNGYFYNQKKVTRPLNHLPAIFKSTVTQLREANIEVINASPDSKVDCFQRYTLSAAVKKLSKPA